MTEVPGPDAATDTPQAHLDRLNQQIGLLEQQAQGYRAGLQHTMAQLAALQTQRHNLVRTMWTPPPAPPSVVAPIGEVPARSPETSTHTAQNILFALGGLLLATAAVVFTAVAWATFGNGGRATILAVVTLIALAVPLIARARGLRATAETFAVLGLLLVVLDGYAAWYVNLFGAKAVPTLSYVAIVSAVTSIIAATYRLTTALTGPGVVAVLTAQPVLPLLAADTDLTVAGWSLLLGALAAANLLLLRPGLDPVLRGLGFVAHASALTAAVLLAINAEIDARDPAAAASAGLALVVVAGVLRAGAAVTGPDTYRAIAGTVVVLGVAVAGTRLAAVAWPSLRTLAVAGVAAATAVLAVVAARLLPTWARPGLRPGALVVSVAQLAVVGAVATVVAADTLLRAVPIWSAPLATHVWFDWQLLAAAALGTVALAAWTTSAGGRLATVALGAAIATLALPGAVPVGWWVPSTVGIIVAGGLAIMAVLVRPDAAARVSAVGAAVLGGHAIGASLARPANTAAVLGVLTVLGLTVAGLSRRPGGQVALHRGVGRVAAFVALAALPAAVGSGLVAAEVDAVWTGRLTAASVGVLVPALMAIRRVGPDLIGVAYGAALVSAVVWPTVAALASGEPLGLYTAGGLLVVATAFAALRLGSTEPGSASEPAPGQPGLGPVAGAAVPLTILLAIDVLPAVASVLVLPYSWLGAIWSGDPAGVGLTPEDVNRTLRTGFGFARPASAIVSGSDAVALGLLAIAAAVTAYALRPRLRSILTGLAVGGPTAVLVGLTAARAPWPVVPSTTLLLGLLLTVAVAVTTAGAWRTGIGTSQGLLYIGAGLAGALTTEWSTLAGLGATVAAAGVVGWFGCAVIWRVLGWSAAVAAAVAFVTAAGLAADLPLRSVAFAVVAVAVLALGAGTVLRADRRAESVALQAGAHGSAVVALLFAGTAAYAAAVGTLWGVVVAVRALAPGTGRPARLGLAATAAAWEVLAWWLLLVSRDIAIVEAYTLPLAGAALLAGWAALRARPGLSSWVAYGPALAAAFLPSLATMLALIEPFTQESAPAWRRLLLGAGGLAVVVGGSVRRRQAPVLVGGAVLTIVALHETVLFWDRVPRWAPLALGGLLLVGIAMTYERRRRDMQRLRTAIGKMT